MGTLRQLKLSNSILSWLIVILLLAQTIWVMHKVAHAKGMVEPSAVTEQSFVNVLWGDHNNSAICKKFDQSCPDHFASTNWQPLLTQSIPEWIFVEPKAQLSKFERFFSAQGPPVSLK
jgi:hypothetical protein